LALRPPFETTATTNLEETHQRLQTALTAKGASCHGSVSGVFVEIASRRKVRFWSPQLRARLSSLPSGETQLRGRFAPASQVWTLYIFIYLNLAFASLGAIFLGISQAILGRTPWGFWVTGAALVVAFIVHRLGAFIGQRLGSEEMDEISEFVSTTLSAQKKLSRSTRLRSEKTE